MIGIHGRNMCQAGETFNVSGLPYSHREAVNNNIRTTPATVVSSSPYKVSQQH